MNATRLSLAIALILGFTAATKASDPGLTKDNPITIAGTGDLLKSNDELMTTAWIDFEKSIVLSPDTIPGESISLVAREVRADGSSVPIAMREYKKGHRVGAWLLLRPHTALPPKTSFAKGCKFPEDADLTVPDLKTVYTYGGRKVRTDEKVDNGTIVSVTMETDGKVSELGEKLDKLTNTVRDLNLNLTEFKVEVSAKFTAIDKRFDEQDEKIKALEARPQIPGPVGPAGPIGPQGLKGDKGDPATADAPPAPPAPPTTPSAQTPATPGLVSFECRTYIPWKGTDGHWYITDVYRRTIHVAGW